MKVILLKNVDKIGKANEVKEVPSGYARNFLLPKKLAILATNDTLSSLGQKVASDKARIEKEIVENKALAEKMKGMEIKIAVKVGSEGQLFESINRQKVAERLSEMGININKNNIDLEDHIKQKGDYNIKIKLDHGFNTEVKVVVCEQ